MAAREELVSIGFARRAHAEGLRAAAAFGLAVSVGLRRVQAPETGERGLAELDRALGRRGEKLTATLAWIEADVVARMAEEGLMVLDELARRAAQIPGLGDIDRDAAGEGLKTLRAAL